MANTKNATTNTSALSTFAHENETKSQQTAKTDAMHQSVVRNAKAVARAEAEARKLARKVAFDNRHIYLTVDFEEVKNKKKIVTSKTFSLRGCFDNAGGIVITNLDKNGLVCIVNDTNGGIFARAYSSSKDDTARGYIQSRLLEKTKGLCAEFVIQALRGMNYSQFTQWVASQVASAAVKGYKPDFVMMTSEPKFDRKHEVLEMAKSKAKTVARKSNNAKARREAKADKKVA